MKVQTKSLLVLIVSFGIFVLIILGFQIISIKQKKLFTENNMESQEKMINNSLTSKAEKYAQLAKDYSGWDDMVDFLYTGDSTFAADNLQTLISAYNLNFVFITDSAGKLLYHVKDSVYMHFNLLLPDDFIQKQFTDTHFCSYFEPRDTLLIQFYGGTIVPTSDFEDRKTIPKGYMILAKVWDKEYIENLENLVDYKMKINFSQFYKTPKDDKQIRIVKPVNNSKGQTIAFLEFIKTNPIADEIKKFWYLTVLIFIIVGVLITVSVTLFHRIVTNPIKKISESLSSSDLYPIKSLLNKTDEFGQISKLIETSFNQKEELQKAYAILSQQTEEIQAQADNLEEINKLLVERNEEVELQTEEIIAQREELQKANTSLEYLYKNLTSSINYARKIQAGLLPDEDIYRNYFTDAFIIYMPRDIVSGDFHWLLQRREFVYFAVADCTGHGVPGAFLSLIGHTFLNEIVSTSDKNLDTCEILNQLRQAIISTLRQSDKVNSSKEGMDISLCRFNQNTRELMYSGAYNSGFLYSGSDGELIKLPADKMPVGYLKETVTDFNSFVFILPENSIIYLFSDGYQDQFGGPAGRKFLTKNFYLLIDSVKNKDFADQKFILQDNFKQWKGSNRQIDDVTIVGIKL